MRYLEAGRGRPLVLLHSFPLHADQWIPQLEHVPPGWRAIAPDLFGCGATTAEAGVPQTMARQADEVIELLDHLGVDRAAIAGVSMGGYVALALLQRAASRLTGVMLADTRATADTDEGRAGRDRMIAMVEREGVVGVAREMLPKLLGPTTHRERPDVVATVEHLIASNSVVGVRAALLAIKARPDSTPLLATVSCPTWILCGEEDGLTPPADSALMHRAIAGSRYDVLPRTGHLSNLEAPTAFNAALQEFLAWISN